MVLLDQPIRLTFPIFSDPARATPADTNGTVQLDILKPDGTPSTFTLAASQVVHGTTGVYYYDYTPPAAGHYAFHWHSTGSVTTSADGSFDVAAKYDPQLISLDAAKAHLNITRTTDDDEIQTTIDTATAMIEKRIGPVLPVTVTETLNARGDMLQLTRYPVVSITDASEWLGTTQYALTSEPTGDQTVDSYGYDLNNDQGQLFRRRSGYASPWVTGARSVTVTYVAGRNPIPADIQMAAKELVRLLWETQRGSAPGRATPGVDGSPEEMGGLRWYRVNQLLEPYEPRGVFA